MFFAPRKPTTTVFTMFASGNKNHGIYNVFLPRPSKNSHIYAIFNMLQEALFPCQRHKNTVNYSVLGLLLGFVEGAERGSSNEQQSPEKIRYGQPPLYFVKLNSR